MYRSLAFPKAHVVVNGVGMAVINALLSVAFIQDGTPWWALMSGVAAVSSALLAWLAHQSMGDYEEEAIRRSDTADRYASMVQRFERESAVPTWRDYETR